LEKFGNKGLRQLRLLFFVMLTSILFDSSAELLDLNCPGIVDRPGLYFEGIKQGGGFYVESEISEASLRIQLDETKETGHLEFLGHIGNFGKSRKDVFRLTRLKISESLIRADVRIDADRRGAIEIDRLTGSIHYLSDVWPKRFTGICSKSGEQVPIF
tara:strand:- start:32 stop:505 length:474 start_codon:yes stop_codon:yes gene_type:complete